MDEITSRSSVGQGLGQGHVLGQGHGPGQGHVMGEGRPVLVVTLKQIRPLDEDELTAVLLWVDNLPISREKRNLSRDFSDGGIIAFSPLKKSTNQMYRMFFSSKNLQSLYDQIAQ